MGASGPPVALLVGLGNPGERYARTRHNAGFWLADELARRHGGELRPDKRFHGDVGRIRVDDHELRLLKPATFMNHSGRSVAAYSRFFRIEPASILVAYDEIDLPPGSVRLKQGGGHGGHNGIRDTVQALGSPDFGRLRLGVGHPGHKDAVVGYVLGVPPAAEQRAIEDAVTSACDALPLLLEGDWDRAFQRLHTAA